jgi:hypothetical protein
MVELEGRDELEGRNEVGEAGRRGSGEVAVASSNAARSSAALLAGAPHAAQKRPLTGTSVPHDEQTGINFFPIQSTAPERNTFQD